MVGVLLKEGSPATQITTPEELQADLREKCAAFPGELWQLVGNRISLDMELSPELHETQIFLVPDGRILKESIYNAPDPPTQEVPPQQYQKLYPLAIRKLQILIYSHNPL